MRCPVCKTECMGYNSCPNCGFDELNTVFVNSDEANLWQEETVMPYRKTFFDSYVGILPFDSLSAEQKKALMLPFDKSCLVVGSAGTGKTTIGLSRAFLTHGKVLFATDLSIARCLEKELADKPGFRNVRFISASSLVHEVWRDLFDEKMPQNDHWRPDMDAIYQRVLPLGEIYDCIILDIGAYGDIEYNFLKSISKTVYALIDKNTIVEWLFNLGDFTRVLGINEYAELTLNYRNSYPISCFISQYKRSDIFSLGSRNGEPVLLLRYSQNREAKFRMIAQIVRKNPGRKIGIVVDYREKGPLGEYLKTIFPQNKVEQFWRFPFQETILSNENKIWITDHSDMGNIGFDVVLVMLNDALQSMPENDSANKRCLYQIFSTARDKLYVGISNEMPLKHQGKRIFDERSKFERFVDYKSYEDV